MVDPFAVSGYRRSLVVTPHADRAVAALEDDYHAMVVTLGHDGRVITSVASDMARAPWTACPGAMAVIAETFVGVALADAPRRGEKRSNCTHLYDLALLAAAHAQDAGATEYRIAASDPIDGTVFAQIRRNGVPVLDFVHRGDVLSQPADLAGRGLFDMRDWIAGLSDPADREAARLLQWGTIIAHGRLLTPAQHADISRTPATCYTFQEERRHDATRKLETILDFSGEGPQPLSAFDGTHFA
jgi:hypothetical protein